MSRNQKIFAAIIMTIIIAVGVYWFRLYTPQNTEKEEYKVGAVVFLTGNQAILGEYVKNGLMLAEDEINAKGGVNGHRIRVIYVDSGDSPRKAIDAYNKVLAVDQVPIVISTGDAVTLSLVPLADQKSIPLLATVAASPDIPDQSKWVFRAWISADKDAETLANFVLEHTKLRNVAVLYINNEYGISWLAAFKSVWGSRGGSLLGSESYEIADTDLRSQLLKLKALQPEAIALTGFGPAYGVAIKQMRESNIDVPLLSNSMLEDQTVREQIGRAAAGALFSSSAFNPTAPQSDIAKHFVESYKSRYGREPNFIGAFPYDVLYLVAKAIELKGYSSSLIREGLLSIKDYEGVMGTLSFSAQGEMTFPIFVRGFDGTKVVEPDAVLPNSGKRTDGK